MHFARTRHSRSDPVVRASATRSTSCSDEEALLSRQLIVYELWNGQEKFAIVLPKGCFSHKILRNNFTSECSFELALLAAAEEEKEMPLKNIIGIN